MLRAEEMEKKGQRYMEMFATLPCPICNSVDGLDYSVFTVHDSLVHAVTCRGCEMSVIAHELVLALEIYTENAITVIERDERLEERKDSRYSKLRTAYDTESDRRWQAENPIQREGDLEHEIARLRDLETLRIDEEADLLRCEAEESARLASKAGQE